MGWETRERGGRYYYRKEREGSRVRSVYVGSGLLAQFSEQMDEQRRIENDAERRTLRREVERQDKIDTHIDAAGELAEKLVAVTLIASGFHRHKRQWRLKRNEKAN